jgi:hypothetical protein
MNAPEKLDQRLKPEETLSPGGDALAPTLGGQQNARHLGFVPVPVAFAAPRLSPSGEACRLGPLAPSASPTPKRKSSLAAGGALRAQGE